MWAATEAAAARIRDKYGEAIGNSPTRVALMNIRKRLKLIHLTGTIWFIVCVCYVLAMALHQAGFNWWVIFSLSGHSVLVVSLLVSLYLFAIFQGAGKNLKIAIEHPLSSSDYYAAFYVSAPFLGAVAGVLAMVGESKMSHFATGVALGTLAGTFLTWVIVDPAVSLSEMLVPAGRAHRSRRLAIARQQKQKKQRDNERLLAEILAEQQRQRLHWQDVLGPQAEILASLLSSESIDFEQAQRRAVDIGVKAWRTGGRECMRQLRDMAMDLSGRRVKNLSVTDYISIWWDGIGSWRNRGFA